MSVPETHHRGVGWAEALVAPAYRFDLVATITMLLLLLYSEPVWYLQAGVYGLSVAALLYRPLLRRPSLWYGLTLFLVAGHASVWFHLDNHKFLLTYWCLAVGLSLRASDPASTLRTSARLLVGLGFLFAVGAKVLAPDYLSGAFFEGLLLTDDRFFGVAHVLGGVPMDALRAADLAREDLLVFGDLRVPLDLPASPRLTALAQMLTVWTLAIEAVVAGLFLWPEDRGPSRWRDAALLVFITTTYPVTPVLGFAWVLAAMGAAQSTTRGWTYWPVGYAAAALFTLLAYTVASSGLLTPG